MFTKFLGIILALAMVACAQNNSPGDHRIRIISYNVYYGFTKIPERKAAWQDWIKTQKPDVLALQELNGYSKEMLAEEARSWGHPHSILLKEEGFPTGITSRFPIEEVELVLEGFHHGLIKAKIRGLHFYVIHLHPSNWITRHREIEFILHDLKTLPDQSRVVLAGDFNTFSSYDSMYYAHGRLEPFFQSRDNQFQENNLRDGRLDYSVLDRLTNLRYVDLEYVFRPSDYQFTGSFPTLLEKEGDHGDLRRLDYIFASPNLAKSVVEARIISDDKTIYLSDHLPVLVDIRFE